MEILPIERRNLMVQNIDNLVILRDYDQINQMIIKPTAWNSLDIQALGGLNLVIHKDLGLERQEIDNFEIIGSINAPILEQEYINSIEIVERNSNLNKPRLSLNIEYMDDLQISPKRNEIRFVSANIPMGNYEIEPVDDLEIIGKKKEDLEIEHIDKINYPDKIINYNRSSDQRDDINIQTSMEYDININDNRLKKGRQINQEYSYEENDNVIRYRDDSLNMNLSQQKNKSKSGYGQIQHNKYRIVKQDEGYGQEQEQGYERDDWNKSNNIQQTSKIFISPQQEGRDQMAIREYGSGMPSKNDWNEKNRTQGIVNLSVIDDNKKEEWNFDMENEEEMVRENSDEDPKDDNNNKNIEMRKIHNDYDSDELDNIDPLSGLKKHGKQSKYDEYIKSQSQIKQSIKNEEDEDKKIKPQPEIQHSSVNYIGSQDNIDRSEDEDPKRKKGQGKFQASSTNYMIGHESGGDEEDLKDKEGPGQLHPTGKYKISPEVRRDFGGDTGKKEKKLQGPYKPTSLNYMISSESRVEDPKKTQKKIQFKSQSQNKEITGMMKKKTKVKKFEYLRDPNQGPNFQ